MQKMQSSMRPQVRVEPSPASLRQAPAKAACCSWLHPGCLMLARASSSADARSIRCASLAQPPSRSKPFDEGEGDDEPNSQNPSRQHSRTQHLASFPDMVFVDDASGQQELAAGDAAGSHGYPHEHAAGGGMQVGQHSRGEIRHMPARTSARTSDVVFLEGLWRRQRALDAPSVLDAPGNQQPLQPPGGAAVAPPVAPPSAPPAPAERTTDSAVAPPAPAAAPETGTDQQPLPEMPVSASSLLSSIAFESVEFTGPITDDMTRNMRLQVG
jgi:hypothetical protein